MHEGDVPWLHRLCRKRYSSRYDADATEAWFKQIVLKNPLVFYAIRSSDAFCIVMIICVPWLPTEFEATIVFICADEGKGFQALALLRHTIAWARKRKCTVWRISTETQFDLGPMARRVGAKELTPRYSLRLEE